MAENYTSPSQQAAMQRQITRNQNPEDYKPGVTPLVAQVQPQFQLQRPMLQDNKEYLNLIRHEVRLISFIDMVHNLSLIFILILWIIPVIRVVNILAADNGIDVLPFNEYKVTASNSGGTLFAMLLTMLMFMGCILTNVMLRASTNPLKGCTEAKTSALPFVIMNSFLLTYGVCCNIAILVYLPFPWNNIGVYLIASNCLRGTSIYVVFGYISQLSQGAGGGMYMRPAAGMGGSKIYPGDQFQNLIAPTVQSSGTSFVV